MLLKDPQPILYHDEPISCYVLKVGRITSGMRGHALGTSVGLGCVEDSGHIDPEFISDGNFGIEIAGERY